MRFWAHSDPTGQPPDAPGANWQPLSEHLEKVSALAKHLAQLAAPSDTHFHKLAEWSGLLHDYGKYTDCFQQMIRTGKGKCPHAIYGAAMAFGGSANDPNDLRATHIASAIAGHHAGIPDLGVLRDKVRENRPEALSLFERAGRDLPSIAKLLQPPPPTLENIGPRFDLLTRMLLSCLVDADRLDTSGRQLLQVPIDADNRLKILLAHLEQLAASGPDTLVNSARREVLEDCLAAASFKEPILSLSVPTGGGKTLSAMAFALQRVALHPDQYRRIIVVIPYLSIIEQNAEVYAKIFGPDSILEHHSGSFVRLQPQNEEHFKLTAEPDGAYQPLSRRPETENWDAPFIVTTSVRFFESLFSNHPSDLRRIHNIARSIIILDEVQVLPRPVLAPLLGMIDELCSKWGCTFLLSTATKPAFERPSQASVRDLRWQHGTVREIVRSAANLHARLCRVSIDWRIDNPVDWPLVAEWMLNDNQTLCVVNLRDHASKLFDEIERLAPGDGSLFHLSTRMCAAHRLRKIAEIRYRLGHKLPCRVVSTQLIEAGVDLDFPSAFRALGPLDSIVQVAGRADREGLLTATLGKPGGRLIVFKPLDHRVPPNEYANATDITETLAKISNIQPPDLDIMGKFFQNYYGNADLGERFADLRRKAQFKTLAEEFEMISSRTQDVFVPFAEGKKLIDELYTIRILTADLRRRLQRYTVGLLPWEFREAQQTALSRLSPESDVWIAGDASYGESKGLRIAPNSSGLVA